MPAHRSPRLPHKEMTMRVHSIPSVLAALLAAGAASAVTPVTAEMPSAAVAHEIAHASLFIVQGSNVDIALRGVRSVGVEPSQKLEVIRAVAADLTPSQVARLRATPGLRVYADRQLRST